jgi:hypothetical protein
MRAQHDVKFKMSFTAKLHDITFVHVKLPMKHMMGIINRSRPWNPLGIRVIGRRSYQLYDCSTLNFWAIGF